MCVCDQVCLFFRMKKRRSLSSVPPRCCFKGTSLLFLVGNDQSDSRHSWIDGCTFTQWPRTHPHWHYYIWTWMSYCWLHFQRVKEKTEPEETIDDWQYTHILYTYIHTSTPMVCSLYQKSSSDCLSKLDSECFVLSCVRVASQSTSDRQLKRRWKIQSDWRHI